MKSVASSESWEQVRKQLRSPKLTGWRRKQYTVGESLCGLTKYSAPSNGLPFSPEGMKEFATALLETGQRLDSTAHEMAGLVINRLLSDDKHDGKRADSIPTEAVP